MPKKNSTVKAVRIDNDILAELEGKLGERTINSWLNEQIEGFVRGTQGSENEPKRVNPQKSEKKLSASPYLEEIEDMAVFSGLTMEEIFKDIAVFMNNGDIMLTSRGLEISLPSYVEEFAETCHDCGVSVEDAMKKASKALRRGSI